MDQFVTKRPRDIGDASASASNSASNKIAKPAAKPAAKPSKPKDHEYVDAGGVPLGSLHDEATLSKALAHLKANDPKLRPIIERVEDEKIALVAPMPEHDATFIMLSEFIVRRRTKIKAAATILGKLKELVENEWTPQSVLAHEAELRAYQFYKSTEKLNTILELAKLYGTASPPDLSSMTDKQVLESEVSKVKGVGKVALRTLLVRMGRPNVLVAGDGLVNKWLDDAHSIAKDDVKGQSERARVDVTAAWAPYRSVGYLLINAAKGATPESVLA